MKSRFAPPSVPDYMALPTSELIRACADGEVAAWQEFIRRFNRIIAITAYRAARRWGGDALAVVDDLTQETYLKLCADDARVLREFDSLRQDAIYAFLKVVTSNVANDYFKRLRAGKRGGSRSDAPLDDAERNGSAVGPSGDAHVERAVLLKEVDACFCTVAPEQTHERDRTIFWLYYRQGLTAKEIMELPFKDLSLKGVESILHRLTRLVRTRLEGPDGGSVGG